MRFRWLLVWLLRVAGAVQALAFVAVVMPRGWMEAGHEALGLGTMPSGPLLDFMIRQASYVYGMNSLFVILLSLDVSRHRLLVVFTGLAYLLGGPTFVIIDMHAKMPWFWTLSDGLGCTSLGAAILWLTWASTSPEPTID
jgi:hypothetical protein